MTDEQLSALLRIKRFEQPPPQYFDGLLKDLHRRQRSELLRRPLWKIAAERVQTFFSEHSMGHLSYAGALASVLVVGVTTIGLVTSGGGITNSAVAARTGKKGGFIAQQTIAPSEDKLLTLQTAKARTLFDSQPLSIARPGFEPAGLQPRYIIDARPASYEPSSSF
jgi:hypothetical protein